MLIIDDLRLTGILITPGFKVFDYQKNGRPFASVQTFVGQAQSSKHWSFDH